MKPDLGAVSEISFQVVGTVLWLALWLSVTAGVLVPLGQMLSAAGGAPAA